MRQARRSCRGRSPESHRIVLRLGRRRNNGDYLAPPASKPAPVGSVDPGHRVRTLLLLQMRSSSGAPRPNSQRRRPFRQSRPRYPSLWLGPSHQNGANIAAPMDHVTGWTGWGWNGWPAVAAIGTVVASVAALLALIYFRQQASVMTKQLQDARKGQARQQKQRLEEAQMAVTPLVSLEGGSVTLSQAMNQAYEVKVTANADGAGFAHNLILNLMSGEGGAQHVATAVVDYLHAGEKREVILTSAANLLPLAGPGAVPHISLIEIHGLFFNPWGQQIKFKHAGRIDLEADTLRFTAAPAYEWPWETLVAPAAAG
jgi:hypothetical protein